MSKRLAKHWEIYSEHKNEISGCWGVLLGVVVCEHRFSGQDPVSTINLWEHPSESSTAELGHRSPAGRKQKKQNDKRNGMTIETEWQKKWNDKRNWMTKEVE